MLRPSDDPLKPKPLPGHLVGRWFALVALILAIAGNVAAAAFCVSLNMQPPGATVDVGKIVLSIYLTETITLLLVLPLVIYAFRRSRFSPAAVVLGTLAVLIGSTPIVTGFRTLDYIIERNDLIRQSSDATAQSFESPSAASADQPA